MQARIGTLGIAMMAVLTLAACGNNREPSLMNLRSSHQGPDEFGVLPTKPLEMPKDLSALPAPTPGGKNITDPTPEADAVAALGGNPRRLDESGQVPTGDRALVSAASRYGSQAGIRQTLAAEDYEWRKDHDGRLLERLLSVSVYYKAYKPMELDQSAELERWRRLGIITPAAPPSGEAQQEVK
ncbi:MAG: DUF3035 domain-containing protein [Thioclava marina]|jgi:Protein of unknown function (DUF3035).|uniref:Pyruvate/2-oxoglutarate dehydrogenase complex, dihydrolipoamide acyltransferase (E2) component n=1 Tax=Thioclava marina TaxID=1915077 RepID=A0ABX3MQ86_9RHOB|nr:MULTISPECIES: DUF3035 domain-containing protein [Thioclava]TNE93142.1 MAG: DUF3035 domain-containing protein [Paracoccaceae bacterium]MBC7144531.1 DUF3035 domain-containing protein [Thioclava marina]OOY13704.1 pyruvate/2-oxoglutarate dehydrogenase complex, dihydrolipoamide acyltransferase (E2) component [Thioclava marina]OOY29413.1 pyruvate/2-oxoglutarate dehydrogenase complex, dihydrolipoamide acyltransferase (E2) component [Thioclava sp. L04-15]TNF13941.1 MAG: DUF3035 domain-containing pr